MRITIDNVVLCEGDVSGQYPENLTIDGMRNIQPAQFLRAVNGKPIGRGNRTTRISFAITREHATHHAAVIWAIEHETALPENGLVEILLQGGGTTRLYLHDGQLESHRVTPIIGCATVHQYTLVGGALNKEKPS